MKSKKKSSVFQLLLITYCSLWAVLFCWLAFRAFVLDRNDVTVVSEVPVLNSAGLSKIITGLSQRVPATLSEPFDYGIVQFGKTEPFK